VHTLAALDGREIVVTGAAGFIGFHVARRLVDLGARVTGVDSLTPYYEPALKAARLAELTPHPAFRFARLDLAEAGPFEDLVSERRPSAIVHLAAQAGVRYSLQAPRAFTAANIDGFLSVLEACRRTPVEHLIYASSSSVYGANAKVPFSEHDGADHPVSLYAATKRANELMAHAYAELFGIPSTGLRFFTVYGPWGRPDMAIWRFVEAIERGEPIDVYDEAAMARDFTYVDDVVEGIVRLIGHPPVRDGESRHGAPDPATSAAPHRLYNIGNHTPVPLAHLVSVIERALGKTAVKRHRPRPPGDVARTFADVSDLAAAVGFRPDTPIETGIARFVAWYRAYRAAT
jgi:UDP-glucuronate 4-epimerase